MGKYGRHHIGKTFNDGKLVVVDGGDRNNYVKVKCSVCAEDPELFGEAYFDVSVSNLNKGKLPCRCSSHPRLSIAQWEIVVRRKIIDENLPIEFLSFKNVKKKITSTSIELFCKQTSETFIIDSIRNFMSKNGRGNYGQKIISTDKRIATFNNKNNNTVIWDTKIPCPNDRHILGYYCKVCESNGFESLYTVDSSALFHQNILPCMCSTSPKYRPSEYYLKTAFDILEKAKSVEDNLVNVSILGMVYVKQFVSIVFICSVHGIYRRTHGSLERTGCHCIKCNPSIRGYDKNKHGYLYLLEIQTDSAAILGYGITTKLDNRLTTHRKNLKDLGYKILSTRIYEGSGTKVLSVENSIKLLHKTGLIDCEGFRRESISIDRKEEVLGLCTGLKEITLDIPPNL